MKKDENSFDLTKDTEIKDQEINDFNIFWKKYDKKQSKPQCKIIWDLLSESDKFNIFKFLIGYLETVPKYDREIPYNFLTERIWEKPLQKVKEKEIEPFNYNGLLKHPFWQRKRLEIMQRDNFSCVYCKDINTTLHIHHLTYKRDKKPWEYDNGNFLTLCEDCHKLAEFLKKSNLSFDPIKLLKFRSDNNKLFVIHHDKSILFFEISGDNVSCLLNMSQAILDNINTFIKNV